MLHIHRNARIAPATRAEIARSVESSGIVVQRCSISGGVLGINIYSHRALEQVLRGFNRAYSARRQRVLDGKTPNQVVA